MITKNYVILAVSLYRPWDHPVDRRRLTVREQPWVYDSDRRWMWLLRAASQSRWSECRLPVRRIASIPVPCSYLELRSGYMCIQNVCIYVSVLCAISYIYSKQMHPSCSRIRRESISLTINGSTASSAILYIVTGLYIPLQR